MKTNIAVMMLVAGLAASCQAAGAGSAGALEAAAAVVPEPVLEAPAEAAGGKPDYIFLDGKGYAVPSGRQPGVPVKARPLLASELEKGETPVRMSVLYRMTEEAAKTSFGGRASRGVTEECWEGESNVQQLEGGALLVCKLICCAVSDDDMHVPLPGPQPPTCNDFCEKL